MEKPLHVQVAEALGCRFPKFYEANGAYHCRCGSYEHAIGGEESETSEILRYDTDWSATGPLIEAHRIALTPALIGLTDGYMASKVVRFVAATGTYEAINEIGPTLLIAVCNLILALAKAGKLHAQDAQPSLSA